MSYRGWVTFQQTVLHTQLSVETCIERLKTAVYPWYDWYLFLQPPKAGRPLIGSVTPRGFEVAKNLGPHHRHPQTLTLARAHGEFVPASSGTEVVVHFGVPTWQFVVGPVVLFAMLVLMLVMQASATRNQSILLALPLCAILPLGAGFAIYAWTRYVVFNQAQAAEVIGILRATLQADT